MFSDKFDLIKLIISSFCFSPYVLTIRLIFLANFSIRNDNEPTLYILPEQIIPILFDNIIASSKSLVINITNFPMH